MPLEVGKLHRFKNRTLFGVVIVFHCVPFVDVSTLRAGGTGPLSTGYTMDVTLNVFYGNSPAACNAPAEYIPGCATGPQNSAATAND